MEYRWIEDIDEFRRIAGKWDGALLASGEDNPFLLSDFLLTWWRHYSKGFKLRVFVLLRDGQIVGGLPLAADRRGCLEYPGGINANYTEFLSVGGGLPFWDYFVRGLHEFKGWRCVRLKRFREDRLNAPKLRGAVDEHKGMIMDIYDSDPTYLIDIPQDFKGYINRLPKKLRYYVKRSEEEFSKLGTLGLASPKSPAEVIALADTCIGFSRDSFRRRKRQSAFEDSANCLFFKELMSSFFKAGYLDANALTLNGRTIAVHFGYSIANNLNYIFPSFDAEFARFNPGHLLIYKLVELGSKRKNRLFDLYTGGSLYKEQWSDRKENVVSVEMRPDLARSRVARMVERQLRTSPIVRKAKKAIKSSARLSSFLSSARKLVREHV